MRGVSNYKFVASICIVVCINLLLPVNALAKDDAGKVLRVTGRATVTTQQGEIKQISKGTKLRPTEIVSTSARSYVRMKMEDSSYIMVRPDSRMVIDEFKFNKKKPAENKSFFSLLKGGFRAVTGLIEDKKKYRYRTAVATIGIRGTDFSVRICNGDCYDIDPVPPNGLFLHFHSKDGTVNSGAGDIPVLQGQYAYVPRSGSGVIFFDVEPEVFAQSPIPSPVPDCKQ